ncbi:MAG TPA: hypothetical protein VEA37_15025, partial [Flavobacterium sp.]|nr:hypothetical protein [Flavobacterium sp.]
MSFRRYKSFISSNKGSNPILSPRLLLRIQFEQKFILCDIYVRYPDGNFYTGYISNLNRRMSGHMQGKWLLRKEAAPLSSL